MTSPASARCLNHPNREAAARCPQCGRFFCRECVTEHENRVLCASCLRRILAGEKKKRRSPAALFATAQAVAGLWLAWIFFYYLARILLAVPSAFHEGSIWKDGLW